MTRRILILAEGRFSVLDAKTATCVVRYRGDEVVAILDSANAGRDCADVIGVGKGIPVVGTLAVDVPAGHFDTIVVQTNTGSSVVTSDYAPGVGFIRDGAGIQQLVSYTP